MRKSKVINSLCSRRFACGNKLINSINVVSQAARLKLFQSGGFADTLCRWRKMAAAMLNSMHLSNIRIKINKYPKIK